MEIQRKMIYKSNIFITESSEISGITSIKAHSMRCEYRRSANLSKTSETLLSNLFIFVKNSEKSVSVLVNSFTIV